MKWKLGVFRCAGIVENTGLSKCPRSIWGTVTPYFSKESEAILFFSGQYVEGEKGSDVAQATGHIAGTMESFMDGRHSNRRLLHIFSACLAHGGGCCQ